MDISFHFEKNTTLKERNKLRAFLKQLCRKEQTQVGSLQYIFCSDDYLLQINRSFLQHDDYTDIITFNLSPGNKDPVCGEIYISIDRVKENSRLYNATINHELHRVIFHGVLHLCGYKDKTVSDQKIMREKESIYLKRYFRK